MKERKQTRILICGSEMQLYRSGTHSGPPSDVFSATEIQAASQHLVGSADDEFQLILDLSEEDYLAFPLPPVSPRDQRSLIGKRLKDYVPAEALGLAPLGPSYFKAQQGLVIRLALEPALRAWIDQFTSLGLSIAQITTLPLLLTDLWTQAQATRPRPTPTDSGKGNCLLLYPVPLGIRQCWIRNHTLQFSRIAPLPSLDSSLLVQAAHHERELLKFLRHLQGLPTLGSNDQQVFKLSAEMPAQWLPLYQAMTQDGWPTQIAFEPLSMPESLAAIFSLAPKTSLFQRCRQRIIPAPDRAPLLRGPLDLLNVWRKRKALDLKCAWLHSASIAVVIACGVIAILNMGLQRSLHALDRQVENRSQAVLATTVAAEDMPPPEVINALLQETRQIPEIPLTPMFEQLSRELENAPSLILKKMAIQRNSMPTASLNSTLYLLLDAEFVKTGNETTPQPEFPPNDRLREVLQNTPHFQSANNLPSTEQGIQLLWSNEAL